MRKIPKRILVIVTILSVLLNVFYVFQYYQEKNRKKSHLLYAVDHVSRHIDYAADRLTGLDENNPDYKNRVIDALRDIAISEGWIRANVEDMPQNLVSWIGGMDVGLSNGAYGLDAGFEKTVNDIINFNNGYQNEIESVRTYEDPYLLLEIMECVLSSPEYMGDHYINK